MLDSCTDCEYMTEDFRCGKSESGLSVLVGDSLMTGIFKARNGVPVWCPLVNDWTGRDIEDLASELQEKIHEQKK